VLETLETLSVLGSTPFSFRAVGRDTNFLAQPRAERTLYGEPRVDQFRGGALR